jgi:hypothetical protein
MASIWHNFMLPDCAKEMTRGHKIVFKIGRKKQTTVPWGLLFGTHFKRSHPTTKIPDKQILYVIRNPVDVFKSQYVFGRHSMPFEQFCTEGRIAQWKNHVLSYKTNTMVRYEDVVNDHTSILSMVADVFGVKPKGAFRRVRASVGWVSSRAVVKPEMTQHILDRFQRVLNDKFIRRLYTIS